jgi:quercetin dioxygenase-like cupin family protein
MTPKLSYARFDQNAASPFPAQMHRSDATALPLVKCGAFGADLIRFDPGGAVEPHTHAGDHILAVLQGYGTLWFDGEEHRIDAGFIYLVPGSVPHAVYCDGNSPEPLVLLVVGNDHRDADSPDRLEPVDAK